MIEVRLTVDEMILLTDAVQVAAVEARLDSTELDRLAKYRRLKNLGLRLHKIAHKETKHDY